MLSCFSPLFFFFFFFFQAEDGIRDKLVTGVQTCALPITFTACTGDIAVTVDTSYHPVPRTSAQAIVKAVSANPSCVVVAGGGVKDTIQVAVLPPSFGGAFSSATPKGGDTLTISSTSLLKFDTS